MKHLLLLAALLWTFQAHAHSGGTDANGCHAGSQPYHCHGSSGGSGGDGDTALIVLGVVAGLGLMIGLIWWGTSLGNAAPATANGASEDEAVTALPFLDLAVGEDNGALRLGWRW